MRRLNMVIVAIAVAAITLPLSIAGSAQADPVVNPPTAPVGHTATPETNWLAAVAPCSRYVNPANPAADDAKPGTAAEPWDTIGAAMRKLRPGETGCVAAGTYLELGLAPTNSGTAAQPIALRAQGAVTVTAPDNGTTFDFNTNTRTLGYWLVEGFTIDKQQRDGSAIQTLAVRPGHVRGIAIRNNVIRNGKTASAVLIRGRSTDVVVEGNDISGFQRWESLNRKTVSYSGNDIALGRWDANAISIEAAPTTDTDRPSVERVRIVRNSLHNNGGDGIQCQGGEGYSRAQVPTFGPLPFDPADIDIVDNRVVNTAGSAATEENAYDIKSCQRVSIRGSDPSTTSRPGAQFNKIGEILPTVGRRDWHPDQGSSNKGNGEAIVIHYHARSVLVENLRMWNVCTGISIGRADSQVQNVVVRRTLLFQTRYGTAPLGGDNEDARRCSGRGIAITNAASVDIYHNTLTDVASHGVLIVREAPGGPPADVDIWNNIFSLRSPRPEEVPPGTTTPRGFWIYIGPGADYSTIGSDYNVFWHPDDNPTAQHFLHGYYNSGGTPMYDGVDLVTWNRRLGYDVPRPAPAVRYEPTRYSSTIPPPVTTTRSPARGSETAG